MKKILLQFVLLFFCYDQEFLLIPTSVSAQDSSPTISKKKKEQSKHDDNEVASEVDNEQEQGDKFHINLKNSVEYDSTESSRSDTPRRRKNYKVKQEYPRSNSIKSIKKIQLPSHDSEFLPGEQERDSSAAPSSFSPPSSPRPSEKTGDTHPIFEKTEESRKMEKENSKGNLIKRTSMKLLKLLSLTGASSSQNKSEHSTPRTPRNEQELITPRTPRFLEDELHTDESEVLSGSENAKSLYSPRTYTPRTLSQKKIEGQITKQGNQYYDLIKKYKSCMKKLEAISHTLIDMKKEHQSSLSQIKSRLEGKNLVKEEFNRIMGEETLKQQLVYRGKFTKTQQENYYRMEKCMGVLDEFDIFYAAAEEFSCEWHAVNVELDLQVPTDLFTQIQKIVIERFISKGNSETCAENLYYDKKDIGIEKNRMKILLKKVKGMLDQLSATTEKKPEITDE